MSARQRRKNSSAAKALGTEAAERVRLKAAWTKQLESAISFLERLAATSKVYDANWHKRMRDHYGQLADRLLLDPPDNCERLVTAFRRRLEKV